MQCPEHQEHLEDEALIHTFDAKVKRVFPAYSDMNRAEFDSYEPAKDKTGRGRLLWFYTEQGHKEKDPKMVFIFKQDGFVVNYYNATEPINPYTLRNKDDSMFGPWEKRWQMDQVDLALEKAKIHMEGVQHTSEVFRSQLAEWSDEKQRFLTIGERLDERERYVTELKSFKKQQQRKWQVSRKTIWDLLKTHPDKADALALKRISAMPIYLTFDGTQLSSEEIAQNIKEGTDLGQQIVLRELNKIEAYERLLKDHGLL